MTDVWKPRIGRPATYRGVPSKEIDPGDEVLVRYTYNGSLVGASIDKIANVFNITRDFEEADVDLDDLHKPVEDPGTVVREFINECKKAVAIMQNALDRFTEKQNG